MSNTPKKPIFSKIWVNRKGLGGGEQRSAEPRFTIHTWLRNRDVVEVLGLWEILHNPNFKRVEFDTFKKLSKRPSKGIDSNFCEKPQKIN